MKTLVYLLKRNKVLNLANNYSVKIRKHSESVRVELNHYGRARIFLGFWQMHSEDETFCTDIYRKYRTMGKPFTANDNQTRRHFALLLACYELGLNYEPFLKLQNEIEL